MWIYLQQEMLQIVASLRSKKNFKRKKKKKRETKSGEVKTLPNFLLSNTNEMEEE